MDIYPFLKIFQIILPYSLLILSHYTQNNINYTYSFYQIKILNKYLFYTICIIYYIFLNLIYIIILLFLNFLNILLMFNFFLIILLNIINILILFFIFLMILLSYLTITVRMNNYQEIYNRLFRKIQITRNYLLLFIIYSNLDLIIISR